MTETETETPPLTEDQIMMHNLVCDIFGGEKLEHSPEYLERRSRQNKVRMQILWSPILPNSAIAHMCDSSSEEVEEMRGLLWREDRLLKRTDWKKKRRDRDRAINRKPKDVIPPELRWEVFRRDKYTCQWCGKADCPLEADHIIPESLGGETTLENLWAMCGPCNKSKGTSIVIVSTGIPALA